MSDNASSERLHAVQTWAVSYAPLKPQSVRGIDLLIVDSRHYPTVEAVRPSPSTLVFGYISSGELSHADPLFDAAMQRGLVETEVPRWNSYRVLACHPAWLEILASRVSALKDQGYDGVLYDTIDSAVLTCGAKVASFVEQMLAVRAAGDLLVAVNAGYHGARLLWGAYDVLLLESLWSADRVNGSRRSKEERRKLIEFASGIVANVPILHLEYQHEAFADRWLANTSRLGFLPFSAPQHLQMTELTPWVP